MIWLPTLILLVACSAISAATGYYLGRDHEGAELRRLRLSAHSSHQAYVDLARVAAPDRAAEVSE